MSTDPKFVGVLVPEQLVAYVESQQEGAHGKPKVSLDKACKNYVETLLGDFVSQNRLPSVEVGERVITLPQACAAILEHAEADYRRLVNTFAKERKLPLEAFVMSALARTKERGETNIVMHEWLQKAPVVQEAKPDVNIRTCEYCQQQFQAARDHDDQRFCPDPPDGSDSCGRKFNMAKIKADIESRRRPPSQFAPPASMRMRATIV